MIQPINIGSAPNDGTGQDLRSGGQVINDNFAELDTRTTAAQAKADQGVSDAATAKSAADAARAKADAAVPGAALGVSVAQLINGTVPAGQLPSFVDDVLEFPTLANFPASGETGKIYIAINGGDSPTNPTRQYRWSGTAYVLIPASPGSTDQVPEGTTNLYFTAARVRSTLLAGLGAAVNAAILASDTILQALAKLQGQLNAKLGAGDTAVDSAKLNGQAASFYTALMTGATASAEGAKGLVPAPPAGAVRVLSSLGTWIAQATGSTWGAIAGTLSAQTDLQAALDAKIGGSYRQISNAWVYFNGTGTPVIYNSHNVSAVTKISTGIYDITFTSAMNNANYLTVGGASDDSAAAAIVCETGLNAANKTTAKVRVSVLNTSSSGRDVSRVGVAIYGGL